METVDRRTIRAEPDAVWRLAVDVERWPEILSHYRHVTRRDGARGSGGTVEMAAWRPFGPLRWPVWWRSAMDVEPETRVIRYRHIAGITTGMDVVWRIDRTPEGWSDVSVIHTWNGPGWPLIGRPAAAWVIGPVFVHGIASRTLAGIARAAGERVS